jgi:integrase/recombinase XerD
VTRTLDGLLAAFLARLAVKGFSARTRNEYQLNLGRFLEFLGADEIHRIDEVTPAVLVAYQNHLVTGGSRAHGPLAAGTQLLRICQVRQLFRFAVKQGVLLADPSVVLDTPQVPRRLPGRVLSIGQMKRLLVAPDVRTPQGVRDRAMIELLYATGLRVSELVSLTVQDIDLVAGDLRVTRGKGGRARQVPVGPAACLWVGRYLTRVRPRFVRRRGEPTLFLSYRGRRLDRVDVRTLLVRWARAAGIPGPVSPHTIRRTCATHLLKGKASLRHIQELLGHARLSTTQVYTRVDLTDLKEVYRRCHPRGRA